MSIALKLDDYLRHFEGQSEAGMLVTESTGAFEELASRLERKGYICASTAMEVLENLRGNKPTLLQLSAPLETDLYSLIKQYADRRGAVQLMDRRNMSLVFVECDPRVAHLLLLVEKDVLSEIEKSFTLKDKVGMMERF